MRPARAPFCAGISCTQALGRSVVMLSSVQVSRIVMPAIGDDSGSRVKVYHSSVRLHGLGGVAAVKIGSVTLAANLATPGVPALLCAAKFAPMKSTYQGQD